MYGVHRWEPSERRWVLWHVAPSKQTADEVARALRAFTRDRYDVTGPGWKAPATSLPIVAERFPDRRGHRAIVTWGRALSDWFAWHVRDALAQQIYEAKRRGGKGTVDAGTLAYVSAAGHQVPTAMSDPSAFY
jgi:hypothetical protein